MLFHNQTLTNPRIPCALLEVAMFTRGWCPWRPNPWPQRFSPTGRRSRWGDDTGYLGYNYPRAVAKKDIVAHFRQQARNNPARNSVSRNEVQEQHPTAALAPCLLLVCALVFSSHDRQRTEHTMQSSGLQVVCYIIVDFLPGPFPLLWSSGTQGHNCSACCRSTLRV